MVWMSFPILHVLQPSEMDFHLIIHTSCGLSSYMVDFFFFFLLLFPYRYQEKQYVDWSQTVSEKSQYNLAQPLIRRDPETKLIAVNFDPQVKTAASYHSCLSVGMSSCCAAFFSVYPIM